MDIKRILDLRHLLEKKSFFLFGPRQVGKSHLIQQQLKNSAFIINLLDSELNYRLQQDPSYLKALINSRTKKQKYVVIDEVQKIPELLNLVHLLIEEEKIHFLLTGSSFRKLKRKNVNLLAGRAWNAELFPLVYIETPHFSLEKRLLYGSLPYVHLSQEPWEELKAYVSNYLILEVQTEGLVRNLPNFHSFLKGSALSNTQILNFSKIGNDYGLSASSVRDYYEVLQDLLLGFMVSPWKKTQKRKAISKSKFYFFDIGLVNALCGTQTLNEHSNLYGKNFEHFIASEIKAYLSYFRKDDPLCFWQSTYGQEVDFIIGDHSAIEVKSSKRISPPQLKTLKTLSEEHTFKNRMIVSQDKIPANFDGIVSLHWESFLKKLWNHEIVT